jgi:hypothetical protein
MVNMRMNQHRTGGQTMSLIHNRMGAVTLAVAAALLLLGAGCQKAQENRSPILDQGTSALPGAAVDASAQLPTTWAEYRSEKLGITIPYPEGWYVSESGDGDQGSGETIIDFYENEPPAMGDAPSQMSYRVRSGTVEQVLGEFLAINDRQNVVRSGVSMTRVTYPYDEAAAPDVLMYAYVWQSGRDVHLLTGPAGSAVLEYAVDRVEVAR